MCLPKVKDLSGLTKNVRAIFTTSPRGHLFRTSQQDYFYDTNTREIIKCDVVSVEIIKHLGKADFENFVCRLAKERGHNIVGEHLEQLIALSTRRDPPLFSTQAPKKICYNVSYKEFNYLVDHKLHQLVLSLTDMCNMACRYCVYSGKYEARSPHSTHIMSQEVLLHALKYFVDHSHELTKTAHCGFYGGEPTLCFGLIRSATDYLTKKMRGRKYSLNLTTNLLNTSTEMMRFFRDRDFVLNVSLDGPHDINDRYRVRPNNMGTFAQVVENLRTLKELDEGYYNRKVKLMLTLAPPYSIEERRGFFENEELVNTCSNGPIIGAVESPENIFKDCCYEPGDSRAFTRIRGEYLKHARLGNLNTNIGNRFIRELFDPEYLFIYRRNCIKSPLPEVMFPGGLCVPGQRKLFVRWDGTYFPCEKLPEYKSFIIGNHTEGVNVKKAYKLCQQFAAMSADECKQCWALTLCNSICFKHAFGEDGPAPEKKRRECKKLRERKLKRLAEMCSVLEANPRGFDYLNKYVVE